MKNMLPIILKFGYQNVFLIKDISLTIMESGLNGGTRQRETKALIICLWMKTLAGYETDSTSILSTADADSFIDD